MKQLETVDRTEKAALNLKLIAAKTGDLPPLSATAMKALQMTRDPRVSARDLQMVISPDQALAARILRIVNSAMYCLRREVSTVSHAIAILGMDTIRSIIMAASVQHVFQTGAIRAQDLGTKLLSDHSWGAAVAARIIAQRTLYRNPEEAFICGLMHDFGKPVLLKNLPCQYTQIISDVYGKLTNFHEAELKALGFSHAQVGALLAEKWNFPPQLAEGIGYHHDPIAAPSFAHLACTTNLANLMMILMEIGFERNKTLKLYEQPSAEFLRLNEAALENLTREIRVALTQMPEVFKF